MFPLWDVAIAPVLRAAGARKVVEIGALRGETTVRMLDDLGPDAELHVIDPVPAFDPTRHAERFAGRYHFHEALSLEVLPTLEPMDAALVDGDHNWYTVYNELRELAAGARRGGMPFPVTVLHDVLWPYGRRDLYYDPSNIPAEFRQPYSEGGMRPGVSELVGNDGLNSLRHAHALHEGGPRNGVMTGIEDFVAEHPEPLRLVVLPLYYGLAFLVEESRLEAQPEVAAVLDHLQGPDGREALLGVAEDTRLRAMLYQHADNARHTTQIGRLRGRYLRTVKSSLLDEHYIDHEVRFLRLADHISGRQKIVVDALRDPARYDQETYRRLQRERSGPAGADPAKPESFVPYTAMGRPQLDALQDLLDTVRTAKVPGDLVECGTGRGGGAIFLRAYLDAFDIGDRTVWVADSFRAARRGRRAPELPTEGVAGFQADLNLVRDGFERFGLLDDQVRFLQGPSAKTLPRSGIDAIALLRLGPSVDDPTEVLERLHDRVSPGGFVVVAGAHVDAAEAFRRVRGITAPLTEVGGSAVAWQRTAADAPAPEAVAAPAVVEPLGSAAHPVLAPEAPADAVDVTVVVVFYNMRREAERTLRSLSRAYQEGIADLTYEVIAVENGSSPDQRLGADFVTRFGPEFRYIDLGDTAHPSPVAALNRGIAEGRGRSFALMIDGAHVVTPGVLRFGAAALGTYGPNAIVATQQWYVGPGQQGHAMAHGYDEKVEDGLFDTIAWPSNGYRLFEIGHFIGDRDWFDGVWESNCLFVSRAQLSQVGGFDENFDMAGGGYANLEIYERLGSSPDVTVCSMIGEASFHQTHGGTTTNQPDHGERRSRVFGYSEHYAELRGRAFKGPGKPIHLVGRINNEAARRTKSRRLSSKTFLEAVAPGGVDGPPVEPVPVPDELVWAFTEAVWRNMAWRDAHWLGRPIDTPPTDLLAYQELIADLRPDWVVETAAGESSRAFFLASVCDLVGHGRVLTVNPTPGDEPPTHARLEHLVAEPTEAATVDRVKELVGDGSAVVILGSRAGRHDTFRAFEAYAPLVPVGSVVVVTDTIVNGHPVWPGFGPGPAEGVKQVLTRHGDFVADPDLQKYSLTFNPGGYLRRVR